MDGDDPLLRDPRWRVAVFGRQVEDFLRSEIGQYLIQSANVQADGAMQKLRVVSPWRRRRIMQLQNEIRVCQSVVNWLAMAVDSGTAAKDSLESE